MFQYKYKRFSAALTAIFILSMAGCASAGQNTAGEETPDAILSTESAEPNHTDEKYTGAAAPEYTAPPIETYREDPTAPTEEPNADHFSPDSVAKQIEANMNVKVLFWKQMFIGSTYFYFIPIALPAEEFTLYYTDDLGKTIDRLDIALPTDLTFDSAAPVYAGCGAGSGEGMFILELKDGDKTTYVSYDNFDYSGADDLMDFKYRRVVSDEEMQQYADQLYDCGK